MFIDLIQTFFYKTFINLDLSYQIKYIINEVNSNFIEECLSQVNLLSQSFILFKEVLNIPRFIDLLHLNNY